MSSRQELEDPCVRGVQVDHGEGLLVGLKEVLTNHRVTQDKKLGLAQTVFNWKELLIWIWNVRMVLGEPSKHRIDHHRSVHDERLFH